MQSRFGACLVAVALALAHLGLSAAETAKFRYAASAYFDDKGLGLKLPEGVACGANGEFVVGDTGNNRLVRFTYRDKTVSGATVIQVPELLAPSRVQLSSKGEIYALDGKQRRIVNLATSGQFKKVVAFDTVPPPSTIVLKAFALDSADNVYALDVFSARVLVLDAQGKFEKALALPAEIGFGTDVAVDSAGNVLVIDSLKRRVLVAAKNAAAFTPLGSDLSSSVPTLPSFLAATKGTIFVVEGPGSAIVTLGRDGSFLSRQLTQGWEEGMLNHPSQMCVSDSDDVFVADRDNSRVQVFRLTR